MHLLSKFKFLFVCFFSLCISFLSIGLNAYSPNSFYDFYYPIYHPDGRLAWNGDAFSPFFHTNSQIAWLGPEHSRRDFNYSSGLVCWSGYSYRDIFLNANLATVYHYNGMKAWRGATHDETLFSYEPCSVFHNNGKAAWKGSLFNDCQFSHEPCSVYHSNGSIAWRGASDTDNVYSKDLCTVYHNNGEVAWRGEFAKNYATIHNSSLHYENGQLAWSGRYGDPVFDRNGYVSLASAEAISLPLGDGSWLYVSAFGERVLYINLGDESYLIFSNQTNNPELSMCLGYGYSLIFYPYTSSTPKFILYGNTFEVIY